jgi:hypothetical protein
MSSHKVHAAVEIFEKGAGGAESVFKGARAVAASEAFRKFNWVENIPIRNSAGNFRGMVVNSRWATIFHYAEDALKPIEKVATLATLALNIVKAKDDWEKILSSKDNGATKGARLSTLVSSVCLRTLTSPVPAGAHVLAFSLGGYLQLADLAGLHHATQWNRNVQAGVRWLDGKVDAVTDGGNIYWVINRYLVIR